MPKTFEEMQRDGQVELNAAAAQKINETTPSQIGPDIHAFCDQIGVSEPRRVPVVADHFGIYGYCSDGVLRKVSVEGGDCVYGWLIWEYTNLFLTAEFHAVWQREDGELLDTTPKAQNEDHVVFAPDSRYASDFDFKARPTNHVKRIYNPMPVDEIVRTKIASFSPSGLAYQRERAAKRGISLEAFVKSKIPEDPLPGLIDRFLKGVAKKNEMIILRDGNLICWEPSLLKIVLKENDINFSKITSYIRVTRPDLNAALKNPL